MTMFPAEGRAARLAAIAVSAGLVLLGGCSSNSGHAASATTSAATTPATSATAPTSSLPPQSIATTTTAPSNPNALPPGDNVALLRSMGGPIPVDGDSDATLTFDVVHFYTGKAAVAAAVAHHANQTCNGKPCVDDDYFVVNDSPKLRTLPVAGFAAITIDGCNGGCPGQVKATLSQAVGLHFGYFRLTVAGTGNDLRIVALSQIFTP